MLSLILVCNCLNLTLSLFKELGTIHINFHLRVYFRLCFLKYNFIFVVVEIYESSSLIHQLIFIVEKYYHFTHLILVIHLARRYIFEVFIYLFILEVINSEVAGKEDVDKQEGSGYGGIPQLWCSMPCVQRVKERGGEEHQNN